MFIPPKNAIPIHRYRDNELLRETAIRTHLTFPENEKEEEWFEQGTDISKSGDFKDRLFKAITKQK